MCTPKIEPQEEDAASVQVPRAKDMGPTESQVGWVRFIGEFVLYDNESAFKGARMDHCISGALPLEKQRAAAKNMNGRRVRVTGVRVAWSLPDPLSLSLNNDGSPITNWCGGRFVLFASAMEPE